MIKWFYKNHKRLLGVTLIVFILIFIFSVIEVNIKEELIPLHGIVDSNIIVFFSFLGVIITFIGLIIAIKQLRLSESRINGYEDLYDEINELFDSFKNKKYRKVIFAGPTLIPGHIMYSNNYRDVSNLMERLVDKTFLKNIFENKSINEKLFYLPKYDGGYEYSYRSYKEICNKNNLNFDELIQQAKEVHKKIDLFADVIPCDEEEIDNFLNVYFWSNGKKAIIAKPFHYDYTKTEYEEGREIKKNNNTFPKSVIVGFKTTDRDTINGIEKHFKRLKDIIDKKEKNR